jgi:hypothetical protein
MVTTLPPINEPEKRANEVAQRLTAELQKCVKVDRPHWPPASITKGTDPLMADVESDIEVLGHLLWQSRYYDTPVPCIRQREYTIPILAIPAVGWFQRWASHAGMPHREFARMLQTGYESINLNNKDIVWTNPSEVPKMVFTPLKTFVQVRFEWWKNNPEFRDVGAAASHQANNPYLPVTVHTHTSGLRIHYSKSFVMNFNNVFGAPTSPVKGWLLPGVHKFAGLDASGVFHYDQGIFTTPPDHVVSLII